MKVLLVEFGSHDTDLFSAYRVITAAGYEAHVAASPNVINSGLWCNVPNLHYVPSSFKDAPDYKTALKRALIAHKLAANIHAGAIFINTIQGRDVEYLFLRMCLPPKYRIAGIIHNANRVEKLKTRLMLKQLAQLFTLSDDVTEYVRAHLPSVKTDTFQAIDFAEGFEQKKYNNNRLVVAVPGGVEQKRRNYLWLIKQSIKHRDVLKNRVLFDIIGSALSEDGKNLIKTVSDAGLEDLFRFYHNSWSCNSTITNNFGIALPFKIPLSTFFSLVSVLLK